MGGQGGQGGYGQYLFSYPGVAIQEIHKVLSLELLNNLDNKVKVVREAAHKDQRITSKAKRHCRSCRTSMQALLSMNQSNLLTMPTRRTSSIITSMSRRESRAAFKKKMKAKECRKKIRRKKRSLHHPRTRRISALSSSLISW